MLQKVKKWKGKFYIQPTVALYGVQCDVQNSQHYSLR